MFLEKIKRFIHKNNILDKLAFSVYGFFWIIRAKIVFRQVRKNTSETIDFKGKAKKILILAVRAIPSTNLVYFDAILGHGFKKLGADAKMLYCDGLLDSCDADTTFRNQKAQCFVCRRFGHLVKNILSLNAISYRDFISDSALEEIKKKVSRLNKEELSSYNYLGVNVGLHARASANRFFLFGKLDLSDNEQEFAFRKKLIYAMISAKIASNVYEKEKPDAILMLHGIYSTWGPFLSYFRTKGAETYVYDNKLARFGNFSFFHNCEAFKTFGKLWLDFSRMPLLKEHESRIDDYLNKRFKGSIGEHLIYTGDFSDSDDKDLILKSLISKDYKRRYVLYPNVGWDGSIKGDTSDIFQDMFDWLDNTIDFFKKNKEYQLIVKAHPAELIFVSEGRNRSISEHITDKHSPLSDNITILNPDTPIRAYDLMKAGAISVTYDGTVGLEAAVLGFPALAAAQTHYTEAGAGIKIKSSDRYFYLLENPEELISFAKSNIEMAKKYAYFYFFKSMVRIPFYRDDKWSIIDWKKIWNVKELFSEDGNIIKICQKILNKEDVINPL